MPYPSFLFVQVKRFATLRYNDNVVTFIERRERVGRKWLALTERKNLSSVAEKRSIPYPPAFPNDEE
jgi:hypothetical protein